MISTALQWARVDSATHDRHRQNSSLRRCLVSSLQQRYPGLSNAPANSKAKIPERRRRGDQRRIQQALTSCASMDSYVVDQLRLHQMFVAARFSDSQRGKTPGNLTHSTLPRIALSRFLSSSSGAISMQLARGDFIAEVRRAPSRTWPESSMIVQDAKSAVRNRQWVRRTPVQIGGCWRMTDLAKERRAANRSSAAARAFPRVRRIRSSACRFVCSVIETVAQHLDICAQHVRNDRREDKSPHPNINMGRPQIIAKGR
jgi:hypothetical protein